MTYPTQAKRTVSDNSAINLPELAKEDKLILFLQKNKDLCTKVAAEIGTTPQSVRNWLNRGYAPSRRVRQLRSTRLIPPDLLPEPRDLSPGPKPKPVSPEASGIQP